MMMTTILKALGLLKLLYELLDKLIPGLAALRRWRRRRRARQQSAQSAGRVTSHRSRGWLTPRVANGARFVDVGHAPVATSADDALLRPFPGPIAPYTTRPVRDLIRR